VVGFSARAAAIALALLLCFCFAATAGEMTSSLLIANARIDIVIERSSPRVPVKDIFRWSNRPRSHDRFGEANRNSE